MSRFQVVVHYRRIHTYYNPSTHADITRIEKGSEGKLTLALHSTVLQLKERIKDLAELRGVMVHLDNVDLEVISDHSRVMELGLVDGFEIAVNYQMSFAHKAYQEDVYSATGSLRTYMDRAVHVGQVLSTNGLQHVRLPADSVRALQGPPPPLAEGPLAAADADADPHTSRPAAAISGADVHG
jgi:hypothetical protein